MMIKMVWLAYRPIDPMANYFIYMCNKLHILLKLLKLLTTGGFKLYIIQSLIPRLSRQGRNHQAAPDDSNSLKTKAQRAEIVY